MLFMIKLSSKLLNYLKNGFATLRESIHTNLSWAHTYHFHMFMNAKVDKSGLGIFTVGYLGTELFSLVLPLMIM